jgi:hypothetical protein
VDSLFFISISKDVLRTQYIIFVGGPANGHPEKSDVSHVLEMWVQPKFSRSSRVWSSTPRWHWVSWALTKQSLLLTCMVLKHLPTPGQANTLIRIALAWAQLASSVGFPILEFPDEQIPTLEDPFFQGLRSGLTHLHASIRLNDNLVRPLARQGDFYITEGLQAFGTFSTTESLRVHYCRLVSHLRMAAHLIRAASEAHCPSAKTPRA